MTIVFPNAELAASIDAVVQAIDRDRKQTRELLDAQLQSLRGASSSSASALLGHRRPKVSTVANTATRNRRPLDRLAVAGAKFRDRKGRKITGAKPKHQPGTTSKINAVTQRSKLNSRTNRNQSTTDVPVFTDSGGPDAPLPNAWQQQLEDLAVERITKTIEITLKQHGVS